MQLSYSPNTLYFKRPFSIAHGSRNSTPVVFTRLEHNGISGYGEASMPPYTGENNETALSFLAKAKKVFTQIANPNNIDSILADIDSIAPKNMAAKAAIDIALHDLTGKLSNQACHTLFGADNHKTIFTAYTIPLDNEEGIRQRIEEAKDYKILKVKLASGKNIVEVIRKYTDKQLIVDANEGWKDTHEALEMIHYLSEKNVALVEQPMPRTMLDECAQLYEKNLLPIIADEAVQRFSDIEKIKGAYHGINIKLMKCTGLNEAIKMIHLAGKLNMKIMIGCMSESSCGTSAAAQLAPLVDWVDLDGPLLIKQDYFRGVEFKNGKIILNELPGIGVTPLQNLFE